MSEALNALATYIRETRGALISDATVSFGELTLTATADNLIALLTFLRDDARCGFVNFTDICGVDWPQRPDRFDVVYHLLSPKQNLRIRIKVATGEDQPVPSACAVYPGADWFEREAYDMYGILFTGHPDLRRILTDYGFVGHPFRKDFPLSGNVEMRYDPDQRRVIYQPVTIEPREITPRIIREDNYGGSK
jgi:NADH-quinone oxidoreductase subunit C